MEATGVFKYNNTPQRRARRRDKAASIGDLQNFLLKSPVLLVLVVFALLGAAALEKMV